MYAICKCTSAILVDCNNQKQSEPPPLVGEGCSLLQSTRRRSEAGAAHPTFAVDEREQTQGGYIETVDTGIAGIPRNQCRCGRGRGSTIHPEERNIRDT